MLCAAFPNDGRMPCSGFSELLTRVVISLPFLVSSSGGKKQRGNIFLEPSNICSHVLSSKTHTYFGLFDPTFGKLVKVDDFVREKSKPIEGTLPDFFIPIFQPCLLVYPYSAFFPNRACYSILQPFPNAGKVITKCRKGYQPPNRKSACISQLR